MDKIKEYKKTYFHKCPLCLKEVNENDDFILTITKGVLKRNFAHTSCFNKLLKGENNK